MLPVSPAASGARSHGAAAIQRGIREADGALERSLIVEVAKAGPRKAKHGEADRSARVVPARELISGCRVTEFWPLRRSDLGASAGPEQKSLKNSYSYDTRKTLDSASRFRIEITRTVACRAAHARQHDSASL